MAIQYVGFSDEQLDRFRAAQRLSFEVLESVWSSLAEGETEKAVARRIRKAFHEHGIHHYFHVPVALFGDRTAYPGDFGAFGALATDRELEPDMPVILDAAPIVGGYTVDTSLARPFGNSPLQKELHAKLEDIRGGLLQKVRARESFRDIARDLDAQITAQGLENCHRKHIGAVLGHRVMYSPDTWLYRRRIWGLAAVPVFDFIKASRRAHKRRDDQSPNWNHTRDSDHPPTPGLWAVEPHIARDGVGAKFEELMVITEDDASWLDEDLPHLRDWGGMGPQSGNAGS